MKPRANLTAIATMSFLVLCPAIAQPVDKERVDQALQLIKDICLVGKQYDLSIDAKGNIFLKNLKPGAEASANISARSSTGSPAISEERLRLVADAQVRDCMKPHLPRLLDALLGTRTGSNTPTATAEVGRPSTSESTSKLPLFKALGSSAKPDRFQAQNVIAKTRSWVTRPGETKGAWIDLYLHRPCLITELAGFFSFPKYGAHSQVRSATVTFDDNSAQKITFEYSPGWQRVALEPRRSEKLRIVVDDIFPAGSGNDVEIAQLELFGTACEKS
jgi:hypothetical protein